MNYKFDSKESLLDFLKSSWENGKIMDADNFSSTWDALVNNLKFEDGHRPEVTITDGADGTHTLTITNPDGTTASTVIHDGKNGTKGDKGDKGDSGAPGFSPEVTITDGADGTHKLTITKPGGTAASTIIHDGKDGIPGISYTHPLDKNSMAVMAYSHTYYPLYQTDDFDKNSPFYIFTPDIKVEVNSVAADAPNSSITTELSNFGWTKGLLPTSYVITMFSSNMPGYYSSDANFIFKGNSKGRSVDSIYSSDAIDSLELPTADGTSKSIANIGFISTAQSFNTPPLFFMTYPRPFLIPVSVSEIDSNGHKNSIPNDKAIALITPAEEVRGDWDIVPHEVPLGEPLNFSLSRESINELPNVFRYSWRSGTVYISFRVKLLTWNTLNVTNDDLDGEYVIQSDDCKKVEVKPIAIASAPDNLIVKSIALNSEGREVMKLFIGDPNGLGLINL